MPLISFLIYWWLIALTGTFRYCVEYMWQWAPLSCSWSQRKGCSPSLLSVMSSVDLQPLAIECDVICGSEPLAAECDVICGSAAPRRWVWRHLWVCHIWPFLCRAMFLLYSLCWALLSWMVAEFFLWFLCIYWDNQTSFILGFVSVVDHVDCLVDVALSLHSWNKLPLIRYMIPLMCCWFLFANILLSVFASMFIKDFEL